LIRKSCGEWDSSEVAAQADVANGGRQCGRGRIEVEARTVEVGVSKKTQPTKRRGVGGRRGRGPACLATSFRRIFKWSDRWTSIVVAKVVGWTMPVCRSCRNQRHRRPIDGAGFAFIAERRGPFRRPTSLNLAVRSCDNDCWGGGPANGCRWRRGRSGQPY